MVLNLPMAPPNIVDLDIRIVILLKIYEKPKKVQYKYDVKSYKTESMIHLVLERKGFQDYFMGIVDGLSAFYV